MIQEILIIGLIMFVVDFVYLSSISDYFNRQIKAVQGSKIEIDVVAGALCYFALVYGLYYFVVKHMNVRNMKSVQSPQLKKHIIDAVVLGWVIYAVYELTTKAIIKNWKWQTVFMDTIWGGILFGLTTFGYYLIRRSL